MKSKHLYDGTYRVGDEYVYALNLATGKIEIYKDEESFKKHLMDVLESVSVKSFDKE